MWSAGSSLAHVYVGHSIAGVSRTVAGADADRAWMPCASALQGWQLAAEMLSSGNGLRRPRIRLWLSGGLARPFLFGPVEGLTRWAEAVEVAANLAPDSTGMAGPCLVWLDAWQAGHACVAVAMQQQLRDGIESVAKRHRLRLAGLRPWWAAVLDSAVESSEQACRLLAVDEPDSLTILSGSEAALDSASSHVPAPAPEFLRSALTRRTLAEGIGADQVRVARLLRPDESASIGPESDPKAPFLAWKVDQA